jgi:polyribonucleotide nucleotidyltransferase
MSFLYDKKEFAINYGGKEVIIETGRLAKQADGAVLVTSGQTQVLVTVCSDTNMMEGQDFLPLTVDYREKLYAAGKFLGGFMKRETRPTTQETLIARLIDRPIRPLFPEGYFYETSVQATVLSYGQEGDPEVLAGIGASAALSVSDIPFNGPIASCKVGRINGNLVLNPDVNKWDESDIEISVSATKDAILMVEGECKLISEDEMLGALMFAHDHIRQMCETIIRMQQQVGRPKRQFVPVMPNHQMMEAIIQTFTREAAASLAIGPKLERQRAVKALQKNVAQAFKENPSRFGLTEDAQFEKQAFAAVDSLLYKMMRSDILDKEKRIGGRGLRQVRPIQTEVEILRQPHGSALFTRGETQVLATATLGGSEGDQMSDTIHGINYDKFYLHYSFPPFSVGESRTSRGPGRRELGHGNLAERAVKAVLPNQEEFPYTIRVACEVLESNGSSSMGSVCSASMALMDAGVPLKTPVAGIAMGLIYEQGRYKILSDILGDEDHLGDMDFKVAGNEQGISAIQMDIKISGINEEIIANALAQAKEGRMHILNEMSKTVQSHRPSFKAGVPRIVSFKIPPDRIGELIGPGGKNIKALQENYQVTIECMEDGTIRVLGIDTEKIDACIALADMQINGPKIGTDYDGKVVTIKEYGAFVDIAPGVSGLVHVSEFSNDRVNNVEDYVREGDIIKVRVVEIDRMGRVKLSAKVVAPLKRR